jgi:hypothetical protein
MTQQISPTASDAQHQPYVYRLTDRVTGKRYIGVRFARRCLPSDLGVTYFTSSKAVRPLFRAEPSRFDIQILATGDTEFVIKVEKTLIDLYDAVMDDGFYNRTNGKAIHPDDIRDGALKEHAKRSPELKRKIVLQMIAKTTFEQRSAASRKAYNMMTPEQRSAKMEMMRDSKTADSVRRTSEANRIRAKQNPALFSSMGRIGGKIGGPKGSAQTNLQLWQCAECGMLSTSGPIGRHQKASGHHGKQRVK